MECFAIQRAAESIRVQRGYTYEEVCSHVLQKTGREYSLNTVKNFFKGTTANPNMQTSLDIMDALDAELKVSTALTENEEAVAAYREIVLENERLTKEIDSLREKNEKHIETGATLAAQAEADKVNIKWLRTLVTILAAVLAVLVLCVLVLCLIDMGRGDIGWFRTIAAEITNKPMTAQLPL